MYMLFQLIYHTIIYFAIIYNYGVLSQKQNHHSYMLDEFYALLTHWSRDKMADIYQTTFANAFSWMKI